ncbi:MAG: hypothetical protein JSR37_02010 [Verrucomicrobia bacterium]|nr:hypothetical protein [Verrucomicrobiota bacterium]MBS0636217.1 hypothetical protein [Verrucomicrobiota bacterium]
MNATGDFSVPHATLICPDTVDVTRAPVVVQSPQEHSPVRHKTANRHVVHDPELHEQLNTAKKLEWSLSLQPLVEVAEEGIVDDQTVPDLKTALHNRIARIATSITMPVEDVMNALLAGNDPASVLGEYCDNEKLVEQYALELTLGSFEENYRLLNAQVNNLLDFIRESRHYSEEHIACRVKVILVMLRVALRNPAYQLLSCDEQNPLVRVLHELVMSSYVKSETLPAYMQFGQAVYNKTRIHRINSLGDILHSMRETAANSGILEDDKLVNDWCISKFAEAYLSEHIAVKISRFLDGAELFYNCMNAGVSFEQVWHVIAHQAYAHQPSKDHRLLGNLSGVLYDERFTGQKESNCTVRVVIGASPVSGASIQPEFLALLQAIENRNVAPDETLLFPHVINLVYTNFEPETKDVWDWLNMRYPHSVDAITLLPNKIKAETLDDTVKEQVKRDLAYLKLQDLDWIVEDAFDAAAGRVDRFCHLVRTGIIRHREAQCAARSMEQDNDAMVVSMRICRAGVDRAMMVNNIMLTATTENPAQVSKAAIGRAVLGKGRAPLEEHVVQAGIFAHNSHEAVQGFYHQIDAYCELKSQGISYPGCSSEAVAKPVTTARRKIDFTAIRDTHQSADLSVEEFSQIVESD